MSCTVPLASYPKDRFIEFPKRGFLTPRKPVQNHQIKITRHILTNGVRQESVHSIPPLRPARWPARLFQTLRLPHTPQVVRASLSLLPSHPPPPPPHPLPRQRSSY